ncbi:RNA polymerase-binding protein DksA, partial [Xanthomonas citri]
KKAAPAAAKPAAKPVASKSVPKPATKPAPAKSVPVKAEKPAPAPVPKAVPAKPAKPATPSSKNPVPVSKSSAKTPTKTEAPAKPAATRPVGKVAVAVTSKPSSSAPKTKYKVVEYKTDEATGRPILPQGYKPAADEEYMNKLQQEYFRQRLQSWRNEMVEESKQTIENLREEVRDIGDEAERATRETENSLELRARDRARKLISKIDSTLKRLEDGDYGYCVDTGEEIGLDRLEARLTAERTIDAQERWEHLQKQQGD